MASQKTIVIEYLFNKYWDPSAQRLTKTRMTQGDVLAAILHCRTAHSITLSERNIPNFMKDVVRGETASNKWPASVAARRYTAVQRTGDGDSFEFVPYLPNQQEPFPDTFKANSSTPRLSVESLSMPQSSKALGRSDEAWLTQTAVKLRIVETHFALISKEPIEEITHLQMSVKLRKTEIDSIYLATRRDGKKAIITCEAKQAKERILEQQIINQIQATLIATKADLVIAIGLRAIKKIGFYLVEFAAVDQASASGLISLKVANEMIYELHPPVPGI